MLNTDYHIHTTFSRDGENSPEEMILAGISKGIKTIAITDHMDFNPLADKPHTPNWFCENMDMDGYVSEILRLKDKYRTQIDVLLGIELGFGTGFDDFISRYPFEFVIGSPHYIGDVEIYPPYIKERQKAELYTTYLEEMPKNIEAHKKFDVYGHMDYIIRYVLFADNKILCSEFGSLIDKALMSLIFHGKGLEINTSGMRRDGSNEPHPSWEIVKRYVELGGERLYYGSDAHRVGDVGYGMEEVWRMINVM